MKSTEIMRMLNIAFNDITDNTEDHSPNGLQANIDVMNDFIYPNIMGITRQALLLLRKFMKKRRKLSLLRWIILKISLVRMIGWWAIVSLKWISALVRFDSVYYRHFKCNLRRLVDYLNHWNHTKRIYNISSIAATVNFKHIKNITRQPQDHQSYKYRFCRTRFGLVSLKRDTEKFKT